MLKIFKLRIDNMQKYTIIKNLKHGLYCDTKKKKTNKYLIISLVILILLAIQIEKYL